MAVGLYRSTDASAPQLTGSAGSLVAVLDAILVNGYGAKAAAGWTIAYTGTNKRVYTMAAGGTGFSLYVDDSAPGAGTGQEARICGFEVATGLGTGTGQFPTAAQSTIGIGCLVAKKSYQSTATARAWTCIASGHTIYFFAETGYITDPVNAYAWAFGDFTSYSATDTHNCMIIGRTIENLNGLTSSNSPSSSLGIGHTDYRDAFSGLCSWGTTPLSVTVSGHFIARSFTGVGGSLPFGKHSDTYKTGTNPSADSDYLLMGRSGTFGRNNLGDNPNAFNYPNPPDGGLFLAPIWIHHSGFLRGYLSGLWNPIHFLPLNHGDTYSGTGNMAGKSLICQMIPGISQTNAQTITDTQVHIEYSDTWS